MMPTFAYDPDNAIGSRDLCEECDEVVEIVDDHIETDEPRSLRECRVFDLSCGHSIVRWQS